MTFNRPRCPGQREHRADGEKWRQDQPSDMYVDDARRDFFDLLRNNRVLVLANFDVDALCAIKILQWLFRCDQILYTLVPVQGRAEMIAAFKANAEGTKNVVLVNCGATIDLVQDLHLDEDEDGDGPGKYSDVTFFVADSHRPVHVCNIYNGGQIRLLMKQDEDSGIPSYSEVFRDSDDEDDDESDDEDKENSGSKRSRFDESAILKRRERRLWEERRNKVLFDYEQYSYFGPSTALLFYDLAWKMSRDNSDLLWWAIIGHTEQHVLLKSENERHLLETESIRNHVTRLSNQVNVESVAKSCLKLSFDKELNLVLYRHWNIYDSLLHTVYTASKFKIWTQKGKQRISEYLAELGLPLVECKQKFSAMDLGLRNDILKIFEQKAERYELDLITQGSFCASFGYRHRMCSADVVYAAMAILEHEDVEKSSADCFMRALDSLTRSEVKLLEDGIEIAKHQLKIIMQQVQNFLDLRQIVSTGPFLSATINDGAPNASYFSHPNCLRLLAHFTLRAHTAVAAKKKEQGLPLIVSAPLDSNEGICLVVGIPPVTDRSRKNLLGKAFEQALKKTHCRFKLNYSDPSIIQLKTDDRAKFFQGLISLLS